MKYAHGFGGLSLLWLSLRNDFTNIMPPQFEFDGKLTFLSSKFW